MLLFKDYEGKGDNEEKGERASIRNDVWNTRDVINPG